MVTIEDFRKLELIIAKIVEVTEHPNADKLYVVKVDTGGQTRQVVAGIKQFYSKEELIGKNIILAANLEPAVIRGVESNGMLLAAKDDVTLSVLMPQREIKLGTRVT